MEVAPDGSPHCDYVVVGSGAGGGPLAANLAKAGQQVILLEAGGDWEDYDYQVPVFHGRASEDEGMCWDYYVRHYASADQQQRDTKFVPERDGVLYPRSGTLGGCTAHNALITVYPHNQDWDAIAAETADASWRSDNMRRYFERLERCQYLPRPRLDSGYQRLAALLQRLPVLSKLLTDVLGNPGRHGFDGWLATNLADPALALKDQELVAILLAAAKETLVDDLQRALNPVEDLGDFAHPGEFFDPNDARAQANALQGLWFVPLATNVGRRNGTREYIRRVQADAPNNLVVMTNALASRVLFEGDRAVGVEYLPGEHLYRADPNASGEASLPQPGRILARKEVILSAGAFNTPQLLKLSGIGPREELERLGIELRVDLPGVGENLQDRYEVGVVTEVKADFPILHDCTFAPPAPGEQPDACMVDWQAGRGVYTTNGAVAGIIKRSQNDRPLPDLFIFGLPGLFQGYYPNYSREVEARRNYFTWAILKAHTNNTAGRVTLRSADPRDVPEVTFHYFDEGNDAAGEDLESVVDGVEYLRRMMARASRVSVREVTPGESVRTRDDLRRFVKNEAWGHHASCTCKMGPRSDRMAVVDSAFRVYGTRGLRVVDASIFPRIPGFFIVTPIYMISEKASDVLLADSGK